MDGSRLAENQLAAAYRRFARDFTCTAESTWLSKRVYPRQPAYVRAYALRVSRSIPVYAQHSRIFVAGAYCFAMTHCGIRHFGNSAPRWAQLARGYFAELDFFRGIRKEVRSCNTG